MLNLCLTRRGPLRLRIAANVKCCQNFPLIFKPVVSGPRVIRGQRTGEDEGKDGADSLFFCSAEHHHISRNTTTSSHHFPCCIFFFFFCTSTVHTQARGSALYISSWAMRWGSQALLGRGPDPRYRLILVCIVPGELQGECCSLVRSSSASFHRGGEVPPGVDRLSMPWFSTQRAFLMDSLGDESHLCMLTRPAEQRQARLEMM